MCIASLKSMTHAIKAKNALTDYYIDAEIVKLEPNMTKKGDVTGNLARVTSTMKTTVNKDWNLKSFM